MLVVGRRGSAVTDVAPLATFDASAVAATGATSISELLQAIRGVTQSADGGEPIFLLNAQRVASYQEIGTLPPEAIEKVEVLPEPAALRFGFPPTRRVVNFITKRRFRQVEAKAVAGLTTRGADETATANVGLTRLRDDTRLTAALEYRHTAAIRQSDRAILPDPEVLFDAIGNVTAPTGGEIDPAFSALAGGVVTVAPVPLADRSLAGFAGGAGQPRLFDLGQSRTLIPRNDAVKGELVLADRIGGTLAGSLSFSAERSRDVAEGGLATARLTVPTGNPFSPFSRPVLLQRYLLEADPLRQRQTRTTLRAGGLLRGAIAGWRWDVTASLDQQLTSGFTERGVDLTAAQVAINGGADPFAPLAAPLLDDRPLDRARLRTRTAGVKAVATHTPFRLPGGGVNVTLTAETERATASSVTRGPNPFALDLGRTRGEAGGSVQLPIASAREGFLPFLGELSLNAAATLRRVSGFGSLDDTSYGLSWTPLVGVQLLGTIRNSAAAPPLQQLSTPPVQVADVPVFDFATGRTEIATLLLGGNPDLRAERRRVRSLALNVKPITDRELRLSATYEATTIRDQTGTVYAATSQTEALLPELFTRDAAGRLIAVAYRPINFHRQRQQTLAMTINIWGQTGRPPPPPQPDASPVQPPPRGTYYGGIGPTIRFSDRLQLRPGAPELDLLDGDTVNGRGTARAFGYAYGGFNLGGHGVTFDAWYGGANRVRSDNPAADLRFSPIFRLNLGGTLNLQPLFAGSDWARGLQLKLDISNATDDRQQVRDGLGRTPSRFQPDLLDPVGRTVKLTLRKLF